MKTCFRAIIWKVRDAMLNFVDDFWPMLTVVEFFYREAVTKATGCNSWKWNGGTCQLGAL